MERRSKNEAGSVTVFLSLTLLLVMGLLGTLVEVSRGKVCLVHSRRTLQSATDSLMTEYSRPLYEEYHLFFLEDTGKPFAQSIAEYASDTLRGEEGIPHRTDLYDGVLGDVKIDEKTYIGDDGADAMKRQISSFMKRQLASEAVEKFRQKVRPTETMEGKAGEIEKKVEEEKQAAQLDSNLLELMKLIDGAVCSNGTITGEKYFMKMFCTGKKRPEAFGISETVVWNAIRERAVQPEKMAEQSFSKPLVKKEFLHQVCEAEKRTGRALEIVQELGAEAEKAGIGKTAESSIASNLQILQEARGILQGTLSEESVSQLKRLWKGYDIRGITFDYTGVNEEGGAENPLDCFQEVVSGGLSKLVVKEKDKISQKKVKNPNHYYQLSETAQEEQTDYSREIQNFAREEEISLQGAVQDIANMTSTDFYMYEYMKRYFSSIKNPVGKMKKRLDYEWEYIVCGGARDRDNLEQVIGRLVLMRTVINTTVIFASAARREKAHAAALAVVGFTGMTPLIRFTQTLFLILWGMAEGIVDTAGILQGKQVPLIKTERDLEVEFADLYRLSHSYIMRKVKQMPEATKTSFGYEEYLSLFMLGNGNAVSCCRMMDLMEWNIKDNYFKGFNLGGCVESICVTGVFSFPTKFFRLPYVQDMLGRELQCFQKQVSVTGAY